METILTNYWFLIIASIIPLIYWYLTLNHNYWSKRGIKGPKPYILFGTQLYQFIRPRSIVEVEWLEKYGKVYGTFYGNKPALVVGDPELIKQILVKDFPLFMDRGGEDKRIHPILSKILLNSKAEDWKRMRSIVSPTFTSGKMKRMYPMVKQCLEDFLDNVGEKTMNGKTEVNIKELFGKYTMDVIATCAFATKTNMYKDNVNPFLLNARTMMSPKILRLILYNVLPTKLLKLIGLHSGQSESTNQFFFGIIRRIIKERKNSDKKFNDFVDLLLNEEKDINKRVDAVVRDANDVNESHHVNEGEEELRLERKLYNSVSDKYITEDEIIAQAWVFFVAGYETTATTLTYASYELAINSDIQERLYEEVMTAVDTNGDIDYDTLSRLAFLDSVISETLRLYTPVINLPRVAAQDYKLGDTGITLYKGQPVFIPLYALHHSERYYSEPFKFDPDRFMWENRDKIKPYTYLPFSGGPRNCVGMRFALMEAKVGLAQLVRRFKLSKSPKTDIPLKPKVIQVVYSTEPPIVYIEKRV